MSKIPFFSVVIPLYNKAPHVARSVGSVLNQTFGDFELIIVNDASTDGSVEEVLKFNDPLIRLLHRDEPGPGGYAARNLGIKEARAEWVAFLDADDEWMPDHLGEAFRLAEKGCPDIIVFSYVNDKGGGIKQKSEREITANAAISLMAVSDFISTNSIIVKRELFKLAGNFPAGKTKIGGDYDTWLRLILNSDSIVLSDKVTSKFYSAESGVVSNKKNLSGTHPLTLTVGLYLVNNKNINAVLKRNLMIVSNRKSLSWSLERKLVGDYRVSEMRNLYPSAFKFKDIVKILILFAPRKLVGVFHRLIR